MRNIHDAETQEEFDLAVLENMDNLADRVVPVIKKWMHKCSHRNCPSCAIVVFRKGMMSMLFNTLDRYTEERHSAEFMDVLTECLNKLDQIIKDDEQRQSANLADET